MEEKVDGLTSNNKLWICIKVAVFWGIVVALVLYAAKIVQRKDSQKKYEDFFQAADQIDVLFLGSSHVLNSLNPLQMYQEYGITSYNMGKPGGMVTEAYWTLKNALDYCDPKCIVLDLWALDRNYKYLDVMNGTEEEKVCRGSVSMLHTNMDCWPFSKTKYEAICDLIQDKELRKEFWWDFSLYHDRWSSLEKNDFKLNNTLYVMGSEERKEFLKKTKINKPEAEVGTIPGYSVSQQYLDKILDLCETEDIQVMLTFMPMVESYKEDWQAVNYASQLARERDVLFYNMLDPESNGVIDYKTDMSDSSHLNARGMRKMTSFIGRELSNVYGLMDHREEDAFGFWKQKVSAWNEKNKNELQNCTDVYCALGLVDALSYNAFVYMPYDSVYLHDETVRELLKQITGTDAVEQAKDTNGPYLCILNTTNGKMLEQVGEAQEMYEDTVFGEIEYIGLRDFSAIYKNEDYDNNFLNMEEHIKDDMQIVLLNSAGDVENVLFLSNS